MSRTHVAASLIVAALAAAEGASQPPPPGYRPPLRPAYSPYLNLTRPGASFTQNYFGLVRPELEARRSIGQLQQQYATVAAEQAASVDGEQSTTGHVAGFLTHQKYFGTYQGGRLGTGAGAGRGTTASRTPAPTRR
jgi:hypothetical protein